MTDLVHIEEWNNQLATKEDSNELKTLLDDKLKKQWLWNLNEFLADNLIDVVINAKSPDIKWNLHKDYGEVNRALNTLHKIANPKVWQNNINIWLFTPPTNIKY